MKETLALGKASAREMRSLHRSKIALQPPRLRGPARSTTDPRRQRERHDNPNPKHLYQAVAIWIDFQPLLSKVGFEQTGTGVSQLLRTAAFPNSLREGDAARAAQDRHASSHYDAAVQPFRPGFRCRRKSAARESRWPAASPQPTAMPPSLQAGSYGDEAGGADYGAGGSPNLLCAVWAMTLLNAEC